jgi:hypothetical protein
MVARLSGGRPIRYAQQYAHPIPTASTQAVVACPDPVEAPTRPEDTP